MKIDTLKARKSSLEVPPDCLELIERLCRCTWSEVLIELKRIDTWTYGKCELYHWVKVLDYFDAILESAAARVGRAPKGSQSWNLRLDDPNNGEELKELVIWVLHFTTLLIEHSFSRHMYNSVEHLLVLLTSVNLDVVLAVLNLLYMFSKRSNFIVRLKPPMKEALLKCLTYLAESWGGRENGFGMADCCRDTPSYCPATATTLHYEFYSEEEKSGKSNQVSCIHIDNVPQLLRNPADIMNSLLDAWKVPVDGQMSLFTHVRLAYAFSEYQMRLQCVQARLQSLSILLYNHNYVEVQNLLYPGLLDELVELLELNDPNVIEIKAAALRTLTSIIHLDRNPRSPMKPGSRLNMIIDVTGAGLYHGFLPQMVRNCISSLTGARNNEQVPLPLATALFSFLYHLSSYEPGSEALVNCGMMESLLKIVNWQGRELEHITFVTRAVRVIDLITNMDMQAFQIHGGMNSFINRLEMEIKICKKEQPFEIIPTSVVADAELDEEMNRINVDSDSSSHSQPGTSSASTSNAALTESKPSRGKGVQKTCLTQRAALLKSMLNFMKKALQDVTIHETIRHVMDGSLPSSLKHIISNAEYYGPSLFLLATDVVTAYVFQEPTLLSSLQENGLTDVVLHALLIKDVPATREVLGSLPNVFSALCLNARGLDSFKKCRPFDKLFKVLISPVYLSAMRNRRSVNNGDTATNLGNAMDELMRHQPSLKDTATDAIIRLLEALCRLGRDPRLICWRAQKGVVCDSPMPTAARVPNEGPAGVVPGGGVAGGAGGGGGGGSSDEEDEDEEEASTSTPSSRDDATPHETTISQNANEKTPIALIDYISNVMKFVDAILSNNSTDDHCRAFVNKSGLVPLLSVLGLPNLPVDYPSTVLASQSVASVCKSILTLAHEPQVMEVALNQLNEVLQSLKPLIAERKSLDGSILLHELATAPNLETAIMTPSATPLLHAVAAVNSYVIMFVNVCRTAQSEMRTIALSKWGSQLGLQVLNQLCHLYASSLWESTILLALCSDDPCTASRFSREDVERLFPTEMSIVEEENTPNNSSESEPMDIDDQSPRPTQTARKKIIPPVIQLKYIKPILGSSSRLGRGLAELFGLLVKLCVGSPSRGRRHQQPPLHTNPDTARAAQNVAKKISELLIRGISPDHLPTTPLPKFALTYLICSLGFTTPLLFDDKKAPYHLMLFNFLQSNGQDALLKVFMWALNAGQKSDIEISMENLAGLPDGLDEFLDAWLIFMEKMVNPRTIFNMTHLTSGTDILDQYYYVPYLQRMHKILFLAMMKLWGKRILPAANWNYWPRIVETMMTILKLIICGQQVIDEKKKKEEEAANGRESQGQSQSQVGNSEARRREQQQQQQQQRPEVNVSDLQQLMDMGFLRDHCYEALILTSTMEHATDYLLNNFFPYSARNSQSQYQDSCNWNPVPELNDDRPLRVLLDEFAKDAVPITLQMLEDLPEFAHPDVVQHMCELVKSVLHRSGQKEAHNALTGLAATINKKVEHLLGALNNGSEVAINAVFKSPESSHTASIITLYTLIFEEMKLPCADIVHTSGMLENVVALLCRGADLLSQYKNVNTPRWLASILQLLDLLEKVSVATKRKSTMHECTMDVWKWFDLSSGKWIQYSHSNNKTINESYWQGHTNLRIQSGRRTYSIAFQHMMQTNEESGKSRPIMRSFVEKKDENNADQRKQQQQQQQQHMASRYYMNPKSMSFGVKMENLQVDEYFCQKRTDIVPIDGIPERHIKDLIKASVLLLKNTDHKDALQAALVMCVRFTRQFEMARYVAEMDVVKTLLSLKSSTNLSGFENLSTILIRHILEEPSTLEVAFEKVLRAKTLQNIPPSYKELYFILRECSAAICRDMPAFRNVAEKILRIDISSVPRKSDEEEVRYLMKSIPTNNTNKRKKKPLQKSTEESARKTVYDLLNALVVDCDEKPKCKSKSADEPHSSDQGSEQQRSFDNLAEHLAAIAEQQHQQRQIVANHLANIVNGFEMPNDHPFPGQHNANNMENLLQSLTNPEKGKKFPLISKSGILKILSDAVRSYNTIASLITQYTYVGNKDTLVKEDCSAIAFVLDNMMMSEEGMPDPDRPNLARGLIAAVASCNHSPDAQLALVNEVKSALQRALTMKESAKKHHHIIDLVGIVTIMIENCPPVPINSTPLTTSLKLSQFSVNNMVRFMMKRNVVTDLARISHTLDLSSPKMSTTVNAAMKPLETLTRIMSCPPTTSQATAKVKTRQSTVAAAAAAAASTAAASRDQPGTSTSDSTNAQGEEAVEDTDNTDHDMSGPVDEESIDGRHDGICNAMRNELEELIDRVNNDLGSDSPMIENDGDEHNAANSADIIIFDDNSFENAEDILRRMNNHNDQHDGSSGEDSDSNSTEDRRMDSNDANNDVHHEDEAIDGELDEEGEEEEGDDDDQDEDEQDDEDQEEDDEDEDDDGDHYDNETFEMFDTVDGVLHIPGLDHESDDFLMIEFSEPIHHSTPLMPWISPAFSFPISLEATHENSNAPGGSGRIPPIHPFLMSRQNLGDHSAGGSGHHRSHRLSRARRHPMMIENGGERVPYIGAPGHGHPSTGSVTADIITTTLSNNTRVVVMDNGLGIFTNTEEEQISYVDQSGYLLGPSLAATLNNVPTSMHWWNEEAKLLDGDSQADASLVVGYETTKVFLKYRAEEMAERRETMKKLDEQKRKKKEPEKKAGSQINDYSGLMDILEASSTSSGPGSAAPVPGPGSGAPRLAPRTRAAAANVLTAAAQEVAQATETLAGSIVDSVLNTARSWPSSQTSIDNEQLTQGAPLSSSVHEESISYSPNISYTPIDTNADAIEVDLPPVERELTDQDASQSSSTVRRMRSSFELREPSSQNDDFDEAPRFTTEYSAYSPSPVEPFSPAVEQSERVEIPIVVEGQSDEHGPESNVSELPEGEYSNTATPSQESSVIRLRRRQSTTSTRQSANNSQTENAQSSQDSASSQASTIILPRTHPVRMCDRPHAPTRAQLQQMLRAQRAAVRQAIRLEWSSTDQEEPQQQTATSTEDVPTTSASARRPSRPSSSELDSEGNQMPMSVQDASCEHESTQRTAQSPTPTDDGFSVSQLLPPESESFGEMVTIESDDVEDPLGLIPGSVPYPAQTDPDDGFFRVNRYETGQNEENSNASSPGHSPFNARNFPQDNAAARMSTWLDSQISNSAGATPAGSQQQTQESNSEDRSNIAVPNTSSESNSVQADQSSNNVSRNFPDIPEGVDPSFLEALPEDMRAEVIQEHLRLQRMSARAEGQGGGASTSAESGTTANLEVNADFLNALPPNIQQEVLAQQRLEQQRQAAALANPNEPMDPTAFFQDLAPPLRQAILADMEESQISVLPPELAAEAQNLRREWEARNRQLVQERFLNHVTNSSTTLSSILRTTGPRNASRQATQRYTIQGLPQRSQHWSGWALRQHQPGGAGGGIAANLAHGHGKPNARTRGRQILDYDSICCLLILLFIDDTKLNTVRLHRVFRNLCYHAPTRDWIIKALLSIMEKSNDGVDNVEKTSNAAGPLHRSSKRIAARTQTAAAAAAASSSSSSSSSENVLLANCSGLGTTKPAAGGDNTWLNISMDAALGCRATVFNVNKVPGRRTGTVTINPQAAPFVYRHALDLLISLAKTFPSSFVPSVSQNSSESKPSSTNNQSSSKKHKDGTTFWEILVRLDASFSSKKGKNTQKCTMISHEIEHSSLDSAPFGQLLKMLASPVVRKSSLLMNKLLRLLSLVSSGLQANKEQETTHQVLSEDTLRQLSLVSDVLTSISCTEEGLEDATALLLNMSVKLKPIREPILKMLLDSATKMAERMNREIEALLNEVVASFNNLTESEDKNDGRSSNSGKGILCNRFTKDTVVVSAPKKVKTGLDLQLSSMAPLISKTSSQASFLRILKVIVQIRDSIRSVESESKENDAENDEDDEEEEEDDDELFLQEVGGERQTARMDRNGKRKMPPPPLSELLKLDHLWTTLSRCLRELDKTQDSHAVLVLQPAVEAFFIVHASSAETTNRPSSEPGSSQATSSGSSQQVSNELAAPPPLSPLPTDPNPSTQESDGGTSSTFSQTQNTQLKFLKFAETHRTVLNQILRQSNTPLVDGPFAVLVNHTRVLDFDVKRRYFRSELERADEANRREELAVHVKRNHVFEDSFRELHRKSPEEWRNRFYIVFEGEEGQDAGGLLREWYMIISREICNPMYALFSTSSGDKVTYTINTSSHCNNNHLDYFKFVGRVIAKAIYDNKLLECYFTRSFYKHILGIPVKYTDMESEDYSFYNGLVYLMEHHISSLGYELTFSTEVQEFGVNSVRDLLPNGRNIPVTEENKIDYVRLVCQMKMTGAIRQQLDAFLEGFYDIIPNRLISIFNEQELELLISGLPNVDIDDLKANTEYYKYQPNSLQIQWFWRALREFDQAERAKFLQFVTGTSKVPLQGFSALEGMNGIQKFQIHRDERSTDRLPSAHTCFNQLDLPVYETYTKLHTYLLKAIHECSEGFGFA